MVSSRLYFHRCLYREDRDKVSCPGKGRFVSWSEIMSPRRAKTGHACQQLLKRLTSLKLGFLGWDTVYLGFLLTASWDLWARGIHENMKLVLPCCAVSNKVLCLWLRSLIPSAKIYDTDMVCTINKVNICVPSHFLWWSLIPNALALVGGIFRI
jgi:hypothetical protein